VRSQVGAEIVADSNLMKDCLSCQLCLGSEDEPWRCFRGDFATVLTPIAYLYIAFGIALLIIIVVTVVIMVQHMREVSVTKDRDVMGSQVSG
jgi:hypothetical protein